MDNKNRQQECCPHFERFASYADKYVDGELTEREINELFEHVETCGECRQYLEITVKTEEAVDVPDMTPLPHGLHAHIMASVKTDAAQKKIRERRVPAVSRLAPMAAAFLCIFLVVAFLMSTPSEKGEDRAPAQNSAASDVVWDDADAETAAPPQDALTDRTPAEDSTAAPAVTTAADTPSTIPLLEGESITFIVFGLCALFAFASVAALMVFIFAAKKKR